MEYARNVLGIRDATHEEADPEGTTLFISRLQCSLAGQTQNIHIAPGSLAFHAYGKAETVERFRCSYGLNEAFRDRFDEVRLQITGKDDTGAARIVELPEHRFFVATLFLPQLSSGPGNPHPLFQAFLQAAMDFRASKTER